MVVSLGIRGGWNTLEPRRLIDASLDSFTTAFAIGNVFLPALWTTASLAFKGGTIEDSMYPGASVKAFVGWVFVASFMAVGIALYRFILRWRLMRPADETESGDTSDRQS